MKLKMKPEHYAILKREVKKLMRKRPGLVDIYQNGYFARADRVKDLNLRFRADIAHYVIRGAKDLSYNELYEYLNDDNINNAVKGLVPTLVRKY